MHWRLIGWLLMFAVVSGTASAQNTFIISDTSTAQWTPSPDNGATFGTPPQPLLTSYSARLYLRSAVTNGIEPTTPPLLTQDFGKPAVVNNTQSSAPIKPLIQPNVEYLMFLHAVGPGGTSGPSTVSNPFGLLAAPRAVPSAVSFTP